MKALIHLARRTGVNGDFAATVRAFAQELRERDAAAGVEIVTLQRLVDDPLGRETPYQATIEAAGSSVFAPALTALLSGAADRLAGVADIARSTLLIGEDVVFIEAPRTPVRYQYLMRRRRDFDHTGYLERYRDIHAEFGIRTPGILGYAQFHVDLDASRAAAEQAGFGVWDVDSVSQLYLESLAGFFAAVSKSSVPAEAQADEERFVDRARSRDFVSAVEWPAEGAGAGATK